MFKNIIDLDKLKGGVYYDILASFSNFRSLSKTLFYTLNLENNTIIYTLKVNHEIIITTEDLEEAVKEYNNYQ